MTASKTAQEWDSRYAGPHALRNLSEGVGGPSDARLLHTEAGYRAASERLLVEQFGEVVRHLNEGDAIDLVLVARRPAMSQR